MSIVTFHRAFDMTRDLNEGVYTISNNSVISCLAQLSCSPTGNDTWRFSYPHQVHSFSTFVIMLIRTYHSGGCPSVLQSLVQLKELLAAAPPHLTIMPGSGVSPSSVQELASHLIPHGLRDVHMSGGNWEPGHSRWRKPGMGMGISKEREWDVWSTSFEKVRAVRMILDST